MKYYRALTANNAKYIPKQKVKHFIELFNRIKLEKGGYTKACIFTKIGDNGHIVSMMNDGKLTEHHARMILSAYNQLKGE